MRGGGGGGGGGGGELAGQKVYWLNWESGGTFSCKFMYAMDFFRNLKTIEIK